jgi:hypothetical protein
MVMTKEEMQELSVRLKNDYNIELTIAGIVVLEQTMEPVLKVGIKPKDEVAEDLNPKKEKEPEKVSYGNYNIEGLGPDVPTAKDGLQSEVNYRFDLVPPLALAKVAEVLHQGANKYGDNSWVKLDDPTDHVSHALAHLYAFLAGDRQEGQPQDHLTHAACRILFALDVIEREKQTYEVTASVNTPDTTEHNSEITLDTKGKYAVVVINNVKENNHGTTN